MVGIDDIVLTKDFDKKVVFDELMEIACKKSNQELNVLIDQYIKEIAENKDTMNEFDLELARYSAKVFADVYLRRGF